LQAYEEIINKLKKSFKKSVFICYTLFPGVVVVVVVVVVDVGAVVDVGVVVVVALVVISKVLVVDRVVFAISKKKVKLFIPSHFLPNLDFSFFCFIKSVLHLPKDSRQLHKQNKRQAPKTNFSEQIH